MNLITGRNTPDFAKDTVYRFMKMIQINWIRFTTILSSRIIRDAIQRLDSVVRANVLIIDDSMFERNRSKKVELLAKVYDHAKHKYRFGFRMLTLGWSDGSTFLPVNSILLDLLVFPSTIVNNCSFAVIQYEDSGDTAKIFVHMDMCIDP